MSESRSVAAIFADVVSIVSEEIAMYFLEAAITCLLAVFLALSITKREEGWRVWFLWQSLMISAAGYAVSAMIGSSSSEYSWAQICVRCLLTLGFGVLAVYLVIPFCLVKTQKIHVRFSSADVAVEVTEDRSLGLKDAVQQAAKKLNLLVSSDFNTAKVNGVDFDLKTVTIKELLAEFGEEISVVVEGPARDRSEGNACCGMFDGCCSWRSISRVCLCWVALFSACTLPLALVVMVLNMVISEESVDVFLESGLAQELVMVTNESVALGANSTFALLALSALSLHPRIAPVVIENGAPVALMDAFDAQDDVTSCSGMVALEALMFHDEPGSQQFSRFLVGNRVVERGMKKLADSPTSISTTTAIELISDETLIQGFADTCRLLFLSHLAYNVTGVAETMVDHGIFPILVRHLRLRPLNGFNIFSASLFSRGTSIVSASLLLNQSDSFVADAVDAGLVPALIAQIDEIDTFQAQDVSALWEGVRFSLEIILRVDPSQCQAIDYLYKVLERRIHQGYPVAEDIYYKIREVCFGNRRIQ